mmetsp:Transcript_63267/g.175419  ORF Transcript_63267/g.175419 Transcript_63267/m.175419 type:complete len:101 (-) Transcript_63267:76-378(-)
MHGWTCKWKFAQPTWRMARMSRPRGDTAVILVIRWMVQVHLLAVTFSLRAVDRTMTSTWVVAHEGNPGAGAADWHLEAERCQRAGTAFPQSARWALYGSE